MKTMGKLISTLAILGIIFSVVWQVILNFEQFGKWYSGYIIVDWTLCGLVGILLLPFGFRLMTTVKDKKKDDSNTND